MYSLNQHIGLRLDRRFLLHINAVLIIRVIIDSTVLCVVLNTVHRNFQKVQLLVNTFGVFREFYRGHFSHDFHAQGFTLKSKALATKCVFQIYSQSLDICTRLVLKTADELILPSVCQGSSAHIIFPEVSLKIGPLRGNCTLTNFVTVYAFISKTTIYW